MKTVKALLFDLGGVIIDIDIERTFAHWASSASCDIGQIRDKFTVDSFYKAHERGEIEAAVYFESLRKSLGINISDQQFTDGWNALLKDEVEGIFQALEKVKQKYPMYIFSNSNDTHQKEWEKTLSNSLSLFTKVFNSSKIGKRKPDVKSFQFIATEIRFKANEILFFDDSIENILGAQNAGMHTVHVKSVEDTKAAIEKLLSW